jgi:hypothetical protein
VAQTALSYDDYRYLEQLSRDVGSHFHALDRNTLYTANRDISYYTVHESFVATIRWCSVKPRKWIQQPSS